MFAFIERLQAWLSARKQKRLKDLRVEMEDHRKLMVKYKLDKSDHLHTMIPKSLKAREAWYREKELLIDLIAYHSGERDRHQKKIDSIDPPSHQTLQRIL